MSTNHASANMRKVTIASFIGALLEWYDFFLYGTAAALVFNVLFFPESDPLVGTLLSFATFAVGFLARPIGGIIFGHYGDKIGRKTILVLTLIIMGVGTFAIGLLPTYESIGIWAPILLITFRILQGIGLGGEYGGAALLTIEHSPRHQRGFWASIPQSATSAGLLLSTATFALLTKMPEAQFLAWGWRIPFLISILLLVVGLFIRMNIAETPAFKKVKESKEEVKVPLFELIRKYPKSLFLALGARLGETVSSNIFNAFGIAYIGTLGLSSEASLNGILIASAIGIVACPLYGALSDKIGRRPIYLFSAAFLVLFSFPFFMLLNTTEPSLIYIAIIAGYIFGPTMMFSIQSVYFTEMFGTRVRYSGVSVAYQVSSIMGGLTPLIATYLLQKGAGTPWLVAGFLGVISIISLIATFLSKETYLVDVSEKEESAESSTSNKGNNKVIS
ncbi:MFS transporter [Metabacillus sp. Hm71]|uniref:MFS transporter n=1 Tax=Metabacillus sp. Hm71 TaxID=3450743 RepID=UPI003F44448D